MTARRAFVAALGLAVLVLVPAPVAAQTETVEYYATDAIGSVRVVFDASGAVLGRMDYAPFGQELYQGLFLPSERFAQLTRDGEAGQDYAQARMFQLRTGRFSAPDPVYSGLFHPQRWNRYSYALDNPSVWIDPTGLDGTIPGCNDILKINSNDWLCNPWVGGGRYAGNASGGLLSRTGGRHGGAGRGTGGPGLGSGSNNPGGSGDRGDPEDPADPGPKCDPITLKGCTPDIVKEQWMGFLKGAWDTVSLLAPFKDGPESCLVTFARDTLFNLFPGTVSAASFAEPIAASAAALEHNRALAYAASRPNSQGGQGLLRPQGSRYFKAMIGRSQWILSRAPALAETLAMAQALGTEADAWTSGRCR